MKIKVHCPCASRFEFEVEPEDGRMPVTVVCPVCGADGTEAADQIIAEQLAAAPPAPRLSLRLQNHTPVPPAPPAAPVAVTPEVLSAIAPPAPLTMTPPTDAAGRLGLRLSKSAAHETEAAPAADGAPAAQTGGVRFCIRHNERADETCRVCSKPICPECMNVFGYVCSAYCQKQAEDRNIELPAYKQGRRARMADESRVATKIFAWSAVAVVLLAAAYGWYAFVGSKAKLYYTRAVPEQATVRMMGSDRFLVLDSAKVSLISIKGDRELWSVTVATPKPEEPVAAPSGSGLPKGRGASAFGYFPRTENHLFLAAGDVWVATQAKLFRLDPASGAVKIERLHEGALERFASSEWAATLQLRAANNAVSFLQVKLATGDVKVLATVPQARADRGFRGENGLYATGANVAEAAFKLLERKVVKREAMKAAPQTTLLDSGKVSGANSLQAVQEMANQMQRESGDTTDEEDVSRWQVTLKRHGGDAVPEWQGEVTGRPGFVALPSLDLVSGGKQIQALDKQNRTLWSVNLSYELPFDAQSDDEGGRSRTGPSSVAVERDDVIYLADQGTLSALNKSDGVARWRLPTAGVSRIIVGDDGKLYIATTTASPGQLRYTKQIDFSNRIRPVVMKLDPKDGRILWQRENYGPDLQVSGKFIYTGTSTTDAFSSLLHQREAQDHYNIYRLHAGSGKNVWHIYEPGAPRRLDVSGNHFLLHKDGQVRVYKFLSL